MYAEVVATVSALFAGAVLVVHYTNMRERRHGEIARLHSEYLSDLAGFELRLAAMQLLVESARAEMRKLKDSDDKYNSIERVPALLNSLVQLRGRLEAGKEKAANYDTRKANSADELLRLQATQPARIAIQNEIVKAERMATEFLEIIRVALEREANGT